MSSSVNTRNIAEHLCTLASLLEAEALRSKAFGAPHAKDLSRQALEVRTMANRLWDANLALPLPPSAACRAERHKHGAISRDDRGHDCDTRPMPDVGKKIERLIF